MVISEPAAPRAIDRDRCMALLAKRHIGRLVSLDEDRPVIQPVNYVVTDGEIHLRAGADGSSDDRRGRAVVLEIDHLDEWGAGWNVVVTGRVEELDGYRSGSVRDLLDLPPHPCPTAGHPRWVRLVPASVTGERI